MDFSRPSKYPKNVLLILTLSVHVPSKVDKITCHSINFKVYTKTMKITFLRCMDILIAYRPFHYNMCLTEALKYCQTLQQIITYLHDDQF